MTLWSLMLACTLGEKPQEIPLSFEPCRLQEVDEQTECGQWEVPENRDGEAGRSISLRVVKVPALDPDPERHPVVFLAGGPGQASTELIPLMMKVLGSVQKYQDIYFIDQRGTGQSKGLQCTELLELEDADLPDEEQLAILRQCRDRLAEEADLSQYHTAAAVEDLEELRQALSLSKLNLYGVSYGTRLAQAYASRYPDQVGSMVLEGVAAPEQILFLPFAEDGQRSLDLLVKYCLEEPSCAETYPEIASLTQRLMDALAEPVEVTLLDPLTAEPAQQTLRQDHISNLLRSMLYAPQYMALLPRAMEQALAGNWSPLAGMAGSMEDVSQGLYTGLMFSTTCAEDLTRLTPQLEEDQFHGVLQDFLLTEMKEVCAVWDVPDRSSLFSDLPTLDHPTLMLVGELDPVTPPRWAELAATRIPNTQLAVIPYGGHNVAFIPCVAKRLTRFLRDGEEQDWDSCKESQPPLSIFLDAAGGNW